MNHAALLDTAFHVRDGGVDPEVRVTALPGDASSRRYYRIAWGPGSTCIWMALGEDPLKSDEVVDGDRPATLPFLEVGDYLRRGGLPVPEVLHVDLDRRAILLEDLGDVTLERALQQGSEKAVLYDRAVDLLADLHAWAFRAPDPACIAFRRRFGPGLLSWEVDHFETWLLREWAGVAPNPTEVRVLEDFRRDLVGRLVGLPQGFVHRDYQSRNLMVTADRLRLIDFQDALQGAWVYDLVALLRDSYVPFTPEEAGIIRRRYLDARRDRGLPTPGEEEAEEAFHLQALQRKLKDAGRFVYIDRVRGNPRFLPNIPRSLAYVREALDHLPQYRDFRALLEDRLGPLQVFGGE
ncbi:MAG TPA: phosphotransferase [Myxococcota bacterium]|nr:phosphotransferase [Myxococcota bacterium]HQK50871.1 phosphotransferase [Myxococcota bacterium]